MCPEIVSIAACATDIGAQPRAKTREGQHDDLAQSQMQAAKQVDDTVILQEQSGWSTCVITGGAEANQVPKLSGSLEDEAQFKCTPGSHLSISLLSPFATSIFLFYQDTEDRLVYRRGDMGQIGEDFLWSEPVALAKAVKSTGIGAVIFFAEQGYVYYQDNKLNTLEIQVNDGLWSPPSQIATCNGLTAITAVGWNDVSSVQQIRVCYQPGGGEVYERCWSQYKGWRTFYSATGSTIEDLPGIDDGLATFLSDEVDDEPILMSTNRQTAWEETISGSSLDCLSKGGMRASFRVSWGAFKFASGSRDTSRRILKRFANLRHIFGAASTSNSEARKLPTVYSASERLAAFNNQDLQQRVQVLDMGWTDYFRATVPFPVLQ